MFGLKVFFLGLTKKLWPKVSLFAILAVVSALLAVVLRDNIPDDYGYSVDADTVRSILNILASSMLAVTTFSLTIMVNAYSSATTTVTPRATQLVIEDHPTQNVLATFLGTFVFSLVGIIALNSGIYQDKGRIILFAMTLLVIVIIVVSLIRWIDRLTRMGRVAETTRRIEEVAKKAMTQRACEPCLGCNKLDLAAVDLTPMRTVCACEYGYVQFVDIDKISDIADCYECNLYVSVMPGRFVTPGMSLIHADMALPNDAEEKLRAAFKVGDVRLFEQDPRFGVCVLAEAALRAMPQTVNDVGTVIDVLGRLVRVLAVYAEVEDEEISHSRVWVQPLEVDDLFFDAFNAIARDSAGIVESQVRLQKCLGLLADIDNDEFKICARKYSRLALMRSEASGMMEFEKAMVREVAANYFAT